MGYRLRRRLLRRRTRRASVEDDFPRAIRLSYPRRSKGADLHSCFIENGTAGESKYSAAFVTTRSGCQRKGATAGLRNSDQPAITSCFPRIVLRRPRNWASSARYKKNLFASRSANAFPNAISCALLQLDPRQNLVKSKREGAGKKCVSYFSKDSTLA